MGTAATTEIEISLKSLSDSGRTKVLELIRDLTGTKRPQGISGEKFIKSLPPPLSDDLAKEIADAIEEGCERVDYDGS